MWKTIFYQVIKLTIQAKVWVSFTELLAEQPFVGAAGIMAHEVEHSPLI